MAGTRRSARLASSQDSQTSSPPQSQSSPPAAAGSKRKSESGTTPNAKRGKKSTADKEQKTIEQTMDIDEPSPAPEHKEELKPEQAATKANGESNGHEQKPEAKQTEEPIESKAAQEKLVEDKPKANDELASKNGEAENKDDQSNEETAANPSENGIAEDDVPKEKNTKEQSSKEEKVSKEEDSAEKSSKDDSANNDSANSEATNGEKAAPSSSANTSNNAVEPDARAEETPSSILEKGIIYFLYRGRVGIDNPSSIEDIARSYILLRPLPHGAKLGDGPIGDDKNCRLLAVPKKVLPVSGSQKWTAFVEKSKTSFAALKEEFLKSDDYNTQTVGNRHTPAPSPAAEGVYAITSTGNGTESHLAYIVTLPTDLGEIQNDLGLREKGSFITSVKNPKAPGPAYANIGKDPGYSQEIMEEFRSLRWGPLQPKHLDYEGCQFLLVGESSGLDHATEPQKQDEDDGNKEKPKEAMEKLEDEDEIRVKHLQGDDAIFADLGLDSKSYPSLQTTW